MCMWAMAFCFKIPLFSCSKRLASIRSLQQLASATGRTGGGLAGAETGGSSEKDEARDSTPILDMTRLDARSEDPLGVKDMVSVKDLLEARVHFGHKAGMWNRHIKPYLHGTRNDVHIFNLDTTLNHLHRALNVVGRIAYRRGVILFINERRQFEALTMQTALKCGEYYVTKWRPGTLTNSYMLLNTLRVPDAMIFTSVTRSKTAITEAITQGVPSVGVVDSDCNPNFILYSIPGNDDTPQAVKLYSDLFCEVILRAKQLRDQDERQEEWEWQMEAERKKEREAEQAMALEEDLKSIYGDNLNKKHLP